MHYSQTMKLFMAILVVSAALLVSSCKKKTELPNVTEWETFQDPVSGLEIQHPKGWLVNAEPKHTRIYSSQVVSDKFYEVYSSGSTVVGEDQGGVEVELSSEKFKDVNTGSLDKYKENVKQTYAGLSLANELPAMVGKDTAVEFSFKAKVSKETSIQGKKIIVVHDSSFYTISVAGFNDYYEVYKPLLDKIVASVKLPRPKIKITDPNEAAKPSPEVTKFMNDYVEFEYPYNFEVAMVKEKKGGAIFAIQLHGLRQDCTIDIDVFPTNKHPLDKLFDDNKGKFNPKSTGSAKVSGLDAKTLTASPAANIDRLVYFTVKGDKLYRIIVTWYKPLATDFKPAFDKVIASLKIK